MRNGFRFGLQESSFRAVVGTIDQNNDLNILNILISS